MYKTFKANRKSLLCTVTRQKRVMRFAREKIFDACTIF